MKDKIQLGLSVLLALAFLGAGGSKLAGLEVHVQGFERWGYPLWFMYVTGLIEVSAALMLPFRKTRAVGASLLVATMLGALGTHVIAGEFGQIVGPLVLGSLAGWIAWGRRADLSGLLGRGGAPSAA